MRTRRMWFYFISLVNCLDFFIFGFSVKCLGEKKVGAIGTLKS
jgi:hypothetical protein